VRKRLGKTRMMDQTNRSLRRTIIPTFGPMPGSLKKPALTATALIDGWNRLTKRRNWRMESYQEFLSGPPNHRVLRPGRWYDDEEGYFVPE
jgi:hypothetical protein